MVKDVIAAFAFFTIIPAPFKAQKPGHIFAYSTLVGLAISGLLALVAANPFLLPDATAFAVLIVWIVLTGGLHLDGFGDSCDGLFATAAPERRLEIMKDPRAGTWAVVGLVVLLLGKWLFLRQLDPILMVVPPICGRWALTLAAYGYAYARPSGMGGYFRDGLGKPQVVAATLVALAVILLLAFTRSSHVISVMLVTPLVALVVGWWAARRLGGGLTGDVYGAICELTELLCLIVLNAR